MANLTQTKNSVVDTLDDAAGFLEQAHDELTDETETAKRLKVFLRRTMNVLSDFANIVENDYDYPINSK